MAVVLRKTISTKNVYLLESIKVKHFTTSAMKRNVKVTPVSVIKKDNAIQRVQSLTNWPHMMIKETPVMAKQTNYRATTLPRSSSCPNFLTRKAEEHLILKSKSVSNLQSSEKLSHKQTFLFREALQRFLHSDSSALRQTKPTSPGDHLKARTAVLQCRGKADSNQDQFQNQGQNPCQMNPNQMQNQMQNAPDPMQSSIQTLQKQMTPNPQGQQWQSCFNVPAGMQCTPSCVPLGPPGDTCAACCGCGPCKPKCGPCKPCGPCGPACCGCGCCGPCGCGCGCGPCGCGCGPCGCGCCGPCGCGCGPCGCGCGPCGCGCGPCGCGCGPCGCGCCGPCGCGCCGPCGCGCCGPCGCGCGCCGCGCGCGPCACAPCCRPCKLKPCPKK